METMTAKELLEMAAPSMIQDPPKEVAEYLNAEVMNDIMTEIGVKLTRKEMNAIEVRINERMLDEMIRFVTYLEKNNQVDFTNPIKYLMEVRNEIKNTI